MSFVRTAPSRLLNRPFFLAQSLAPVLFSPSTNTLVPHGQLSRSLFTLPVAMDQSNPRNRRPNRRKRPAPSVGSAADSSSRQPRSRSFHQATAETSGSQQRSNSASSSSSGARIGAVIDPNAPRFADLASENLLHPVLIDTITQDLKFDRMSPVQAATLRHLIVDKGDVLAQAKTGTGKTVAFLLPAIQNMLNRPQMPTQSISVLVISPTRELALQIAKEAQALLKRLPHFKVCTAIGGTNKNVEQRAILRGCDILVATPGRLNDHLEDEAMASILQGIDTFVLDEADRLLDMGFMPQLKKIVSFLPDRKVHPRQGMLFSATVPEHVSSVSSIALAPGYKYISTIPKGEVNTHERVPQHLVVVPNFSDVAAGLVGALRHELDQTADKGSFKAIVFAPTAGLADFYAAIVSAMPGMPRALTLHSRMTQSKRTKVTEDFRGSSATILFATDVVARGMDFPAVSNVFQVGLPFDKESYIHRLGRTARAGAEGRGTFIVTEAETYFPRKVMKDIKFINQPADLSASQAVLDIATGLDTHRKTYQAWLGFYKTYIKPLGWDSEELVRQANRLAKDGFGSPETPGIEKSTVGKMGLKGVKGLNIVPTAPRPPRGGRRDGSNF